MSIHYCRLAGQSPLAFTSEIKLKIANLVSSKMLHWQVTCGSQNQRQEVYCAHLDHTRLFPFHGCARSNLQFLTVLSLKLFRLTHVHAWMAYQLFNFGCACWKHCPVSQSSETLSVIYAIESHRLSHILTFVYMSQLTMFCPTFPTAFIQTNFTPSKTMRP